MNKCIRIISQYIIYKILYRTTPHLFLGRMKVFANNLKGIVSYIGLRTGDEDKEMMRNHALEIIALVFNHTFQMHTN